MSLRPLGPCSYAAMPNFGLVEVDWSAGVVHLSVRDAAGGGVAVGKDGRAHNQLSFRLADCALLPLTG